MKIIFYSLSFSSTDLCKGQRIRSNVLRVIYDVEGRVFRSHLGDSDIVWMDSTLEEHHMPLILELYWIDLQVYAGCVTRR